MLTGEKIWLSSKRCHRHIGRLCDQSKNAEKKKNNKKLCVRMHLMSLLLLKLLKLFPIILG